MRRVYGLGNESPLGQEVENEVVLFFAGDVAIVQNHGIVGLTKGADGSGAVLSVAVDDVLEDVL